MELPILGLPDPGGWVQGWNPIHMTLRPKQQIYSREMLTFYVTE